MWSEFKAIDPPPDFRLLFDGAGGAASWFDTFCVFLGQALKTDRALKSYFTANRLEGIFGESVDPRRVLDELVAESERRLATVQRAAVEARPASDLAERKAVILARLPAGERRSLETQISALRTHHHASDALIGELLTLLGRAEVLDGWVLHAFKRQINAIVGVLKDASSPTKTPGDRSGEGGAAGRTGARRSRHCLRRLCARRRHAEGGPPFFRDGRRRRPR